MDSTDEKLIERLQDHLATIRKAAGWTGEQLANELGVTKQTVSSLETGKTKMTKMHYLAIRAVFNNEIAVSGNGDLAKIIQIFVDEPVASGIDGQSEGVVSDGGKGGGARRSALVGATALTAALSPAAALAPALGTLAYQLAKAIKE